MANPNRDLDEQIEAYRDGQMDGPERQDFEALIDSDPELRERIRLAESIDDSLKRSFAPPAADPSFLFQESSAPEADDLVGVAGADGLGPSSTESRRRSRTMYLAIAACIAWIVVASQIYLSVEPPREVAIRERPLNEIYEECVEEGFKPYWVCDDDLLFAATFERRQGVPLELVDLPSGREMVGLSYLAGISRKSTSMLALVDDVPVVVFVDRIDRDWKPPVGPVEGSDLRVKRAERHGLVFYEVSPFEEAVFVDHFSIHKSPPI